MRRIFVVTVAVAAATAGFTGSAIAADGQGLLAALDAARDPARQGDSA
jgi:hypothetical protein